jgi:hypothetical protein
VRLTDEVASSRKATTIDLVERHWWTAVQGQRLNEGRRPDRDQVQMTSDMERSKWFREREREREREKKKDVEQMVSGVLWSTNRALKRIEMSVNWEEHVAQDDDDTRRRRKKKNNRTRVEGHSKSICLSG